MRTAVELVRCNYQVVFVISGFHVFNTGEISLNLGVDAVFRLVKILAGLSRKDCTRTFEHVGVADDCCVRSIGSVAFSFHLALKQLVKRNHTGGGAIANVKDATRAPCPPAHAGTGLTEHIVHTRVILQEHASNVRININRHDSWRVRAALLQRNIILGRGGSDLLWVVVCKQVSVDRVSELGTHRQHFATNGLSRGCARVEPRLLTGAKIRDGVVVVPGTGMTLITMTVCVI